MIYHGDFCLDCTVHMYFNAAGVTNKSKKSVSAGNLSESSVKIYKNSNPTPRAGTSGISVAVDFDSIVGANTITIDLSENVSEFYTYRADYLVMLQNILVANETVNPIIGSFSILNRYGSLIAGYTDGIWIDTVGGTPGANPGQQGTFSIPVSNLADALTLSGILNIKRFRMVNSSSITFTSSMDDYEFYGTHWTLNLGNQSFEHGVVEGAHILGECNAVVHKPHFRDCYFKTCTLPTVHAHNCSFEGDMTLKGTDCYVFDKCYSELICITPPKFIFTNTVGTQINFRHVSCGIHVKNMGIESGHNILAEGEGQLISDADSVGGNVILRGNFKVANNGSISVDETANVNRPNVNSEVTNVFDTPTPLIVSPESPYDQFRKIQRYFRFDNKYIAIGP